MLNSLAIFGSWYRWWFEVKSFWRERGWWGLAQHQTQSCQRPIGGANWAYYKKLKEALNELVQNIWSKMDLEELEASKEHEGQPLIHLI